MEWSNDLIMEFIRLYEKHPVLWNPKHPKHKNRKCLNGAWQAIAKEFSSDVSSIDVLRKKKESLMATYRTLSKKVRDSEATGSEPKDVYAPSWFAYFAIDRIISATGKKAPSLKLEIEEEIEDVERQDNEPNLARETRRAKIKNSNFAFTQRASKNKRKVSPKTDPHVNKHIKQASGASLTARSQTQPLHDAPALYGQLLAAKLRRLTERTRLILQNKIDNLVFEVELGEIDNLNIARFDTTYLSPNSCSPIPPSPSNSHLSPNPSHGDSPGPSHISQGSK